MTYGKVNRRKLWQEKPSFSLLFRPFTANLLPREFAWRGHLARVGFAPIGRKLKARAEMVDWKYGRA
jgi:hypothetical protein